MVAATLSVSLAACSGSASEQSLVTDAGLDSDGSSGSGSGAHGGTAGTGALGGNGGSSGSGGSAGVGAQGGSGAAGVDASLCTDGDGGEPSVRSAATGVNGTFTDACDADGNLTEYLCEVRYEACQPNCWDCPPCSVSTGQVIPQHIDCNGTCVDGTCVTRCPDFGDGLRYLSVDASGDVTFLNLTDQRRYACSLTWDATSDSYDCKSQPYAGLETQVSSLGLFSSYCAGGTFGGVGVKIVSSASNETCGYQCTIMN